MFINHSMSRNPIVELSLIRKQDLKAIQPTCPWILWYLTTAVILNKSMRRNVLKDLLKVNQEESYP